MGDLERRARRLEEEAELKLRAEQRAAERVLREALERVSAPELQAMSEHFHRSERDEWKQEDEPLMRRLLGLMEQVRAEHRADRGDFPWRSEIEAKGEHGD
jgi:hypothetical protein